MTIRYPLTTPPAALRPVSDTELPVDLLRQTGDGIAVAIFAAHEFDGWVSAPEPAWPGPRDEVAGVLRDAARALGAAGRERELLPEQVLIALKREAERAGLRPTSHQTWWRIMAPAVRWMLEGYFAVPTRGKAGGDP